MKTSKFIANVFIVSSLLLGGCSSNKTANEGTVDSQEDKGLEVIGDSITYDPNHLVNDGKPITIKYWTGAAKDQDPVVKMIKKYEKIYPNVKFDVQAKAWADYWTKLPLALKGDDGPNIFNVHNAYDEVISPYAANYDIPLDQLEKDYIGVEQHEKDGGVQYIDYAIGSGGIYYNKKMWSDAGLTDADFPKTWDEFREVAKKLTKYDGSKLVQAGFSFNGTSYRTLLWAMNYQKGGLMFSEDGKKLTFDTNISKENTQILMDFYNKDKVGDAEFGTTDVESFGNQQCAMIYQWGSFEGTLKSDYPDVDWGIFPTPTFDVNNTFAYDRYNGESTPGINKKNSEAEMAVVQDFVKFMLAGDEYCKLGSMQYSSFPTKVSLKDDKEILANPMLNAIAPRVDRLIWPGPFPSTLEAPVDSAGEDIMYNGMSIDQALAKAQKQLDIDIEKAGFISIENQYQYYDEHK